MCAKIHFDPDKARGPAQTPSFFGPGDSDSAGQDVTAQFAPPGEQPMTVSAMLARVKGALADRLPRRMAVLGEISNFKRHSSGHLYFSLKDAEGQIAAVMFRASASRLKFCPTDGLDVVAEGRVDVYESQGKLQFYVEALSPRGAGSLELAYRQLVEKLQRAGLFDPAHKKPIPRYPHTICVITSPTGAAIRDIRRTLARRWPAATVYLIGVRVQGEGAAEEIARAIRLADANAQHLAIDTLIVGRGGGSLEDLWCFNEEIVARAIYDCRVPIVTGIGHEVDTTIADLTADLRAATPTAAAEQATPNAAELRRSMAATASLLGRRVSARLAEGAAALRYVQRSEFFRDPMHRIRTLQQRLDENASHIRAALVARASAARSVLAGQAERLRWQMGKLAKTKADLLAARYARYVAANPRHRVALGRRDVESAQRRLEMLLRGLLAASASKIDRYERMLGALSYKNVLARGFSVTRRGDGTILHHAAEAKGGDALKTELADGEVRSVVDGQPAPRRTKHKVDKDTPGLF